MNVTMQIPTVISGNLFQYYIIIPVSIVCAFVALFAACTILIFVWRTKRLHTVTHLLICNTCISSIFFCAVQCINYVYLAFILWETSDSACRWRGYFAYMSIAGVVYSYLIQAISRYFFSIRLQNARWIITFKTHFILILIQWIVVIIIPLPALITKDIVFRPFGLCWVPKNDNLHTAYTYVVYYFAPIAVIVVLYLNIYIGVKRSGNNTIARQNRKKRDLELLRNIMILFGIYIAGGFPTLLYIFSGVGVFYSFGIFFAILTVAVEKVVTIVIDRELRTIVKNIRQLQRTHVAPIAINVIPMIDTRRTRNAAQL